jgi:tRNA(Ile)-lysidine synthase
MALEGGIDLVLLAHHRRDQAETFLLQALRGGGVAALSAMPAIASREGVTWARPWLQQPAERIADYARRHRLRWVDDDTNADARFARNRLRAQVWPALVAAFPEAEGSLATAAGWMQQAASIVGEVAAGDLDRIGDGERLDIAAWRQLPPPRRTQALRAWLQARGGEPAPASLVERLKVELMDSPNGRWPAPGGTLQSYRGRLAWLPVESPAVEGAAQAIDLSRPGRVEAPSWRGAFQVDRVDGGGIGVDCAARLELRGRRPGDRFQAGPGRPPRSLKLQYQAAGVPVRQRGGPIVCLGERVVYVPGLGIDARSLAPPGEAQVALAWLPS